MLVSWFSQSPWKRALRPRPRVTCDFCQSFFAPHQKPTWKRDQAQITSDSKKEWHIIRRRTNSKDSSKKERSEKRPNPMWKGGKIKCRGAHKFRRIIYAGALIAMNWVNLTYTQKLYWYIKGTRVLLVYPTPVDALRMCWLFDHSRRAHTHVVHEKKKTPTAAKDKGGEQRGISCAH